MSDNNGKDAARELLLARRKIDTRLLDPGGVHGKPVVLPGVDGVPFRGRIPDLKDTDAKQPEIGYETFVEILDLSKPEDLKHYEDIWQLISNQYALLSSEEKHYDPDRKNWRVFIRWALMYTYVPGAT
jgi:hypothetical protein